jgi:hypothetical protein
MILYPFISSTADGLLNPQQMGIDDGVLLKHRHAEQIGFS